MRLEDIKITPEAKRLFERAVDRALSGAKDSKSAATKAAPARPPTSGKAKRAKPS